LALSEFLETLHEEFCTLAREFCRLKAGLKPAVLTNMPNTADEIIRRLKIKGMQKLKVTLESEDGEKLTCWFYAPRHLMLFVYGNLLHKKVFDDYMLGLLMGFPRCCIEQYAFKDGGILKAYERYKEECGKEDPYNIKISNREGYYIQTGVISHIPCSPRCKETWYLANKFKDLCYICDDLTNCACAI